MLIKLTKEMTDSERIAAENSNNQYLKALAYAPVGMIIPFAGSDAPNTFFICAGSYLDTTEYADLFSVIGYTYGGSGDNFKLPDLRGKTIVGLNATDADFNQLGETGGKALNDMPPYMVTNFIIKAVNDVVDLSDDSYGSGGTGASITVDQSYSATSKNAQSGKAVAQAVSTKQNTLVSGTNIKTINGQSILGSGNIEIEGGTGASTDEIVTAVIEKLPIYNGEVGSV